MNYKLEIKQIVDYPRCRIYRDFIRTLMKDKSIRTTGSSYLFYYIVLCSFANYRASYRKLEGISYLIEPGEWVCRTSELTEWFRTRYQHQAISSRNSTGLGLSIAKMLTERMGGSISAQYQNKRLHVTIDFS